METQERIMATLEPYFGKRTGTLDLYVDSFKIGSGSFTTFSNFEAEITGSYTVFGQPGTFAIAIKLTDNDPVATHGPCEITINGQKDGAGKYQTTNQKLTLATTLNAGTLDIYVKQGGTQIDRVTGHNFWLG
jgi:hypothetical protein